MATKESTIERYKREIEKYKGKLKKVDHWADLRKEKFEAKIKSLKARISALK